MDAFPNQSQTITEAQVFGGFAFPERSIFVGLGLQPGLIVHESTHVLLHQALGTTALPIPAWLDEGFATSQEPASRPSSPRNLASRALPLRAMSVVPGKPPAIRIFYQKAESVVAYLIVSYGTESFQQFLGQLRQGSSIDAALLRTYGFDTDGLDQRWAAGAAEPPAPEPGAPAGSPPSAPDSRARPSVWANLDTFVFAGLVLLAMAVVVGRYIIRRLRSDRKRVV